MAAASPFRGNASRAAAPAADDGEPERIPLYRFLGPRHWGVWLLVAWMRLAAALPWRWSVLLHKALGRLLMPFLRSQLRTVTRNIEACFPALSASEVHDLVGRHFASLGVFIAETAFAWFCPPGRIEKLFNIIGREHLDAALAQGKGVILYGAHFTTLELCGRQVKGLVPLFAFMYRNRSSELLNEVQKRGRCRTAHTSFARDNVRAMMRSLRSNAVVWYAADQVCLDKYGELVPFFGLPAMTNTATSRIARVSGAAVVPFSFRRLDDDSGYELEFGAALTEFPSASAFDDTVRLMKHLEGFIRRAPDQYLWIHRRFSGRPQPLPNIYARRS